VNHGGGEPAMVLAPDRGDGKGEVQERENNKMWTKQVFGQRTKSLSKMIGNDRAGVYFG